MEQAASRIGNSLKNMATGVLGHAVTLILQFVYRTIFIQTLGVTYLSVNGLFANILTIFSFAELGIGQAIIFGLYKPIRDNNIPKIQAYMELYRKTYMAIGTAIMCLGIAFIPILPLLLKSSADGIENLYVIYLLFVLESGVSYFFSYRQSFLSACQKQYVLNLTGCVFSLLREGLRILIIVTTRQYLPVLAFSVAWTIIQNVWLARKIGRLYPYIRNTRHAKLPKEEHISVFKNIKALLIYKVGTLALNSTDNIIITTVVGLNWVGLYSNYQVLVTSVSAFISILFSSLTASIGNLNAGDDVHQKKRIFNVTNLATFWIYAISSVCFMVALTPTITVWLGEAWALDFATVIIISLNIYIGGMLFAPFNYRQTMGLFVYGKWRPIVSAVINVVVSIILGKVWGLKGVLAGTAIARLTTNVWFDPYIVYKKGFHESPTEYYIQYLLFALLLIVSGGIGYCISNLTIWGGLADILMHCLLCAFVLSTLYTLIFCKTEAFGYLKQVVKTYLDRISKKQHKEGP